MKYFWKTLLYKFFISTLVALFIQSNASACPDINSLTDRNCDGRLVVVGFGDSITFGRGDSTGLSYIGRLKLLHPQIEVVNLGVPGEKSAVGDRRAARTLPYVPEADYTIVLEGVNDFFLPTRSFNNTKDHLLSMVRIAKNVGAQGLLANLTSIKRPNQAPWVKGVNSSISPFRNVDFYSLGTAIISGDKLHPDDNGYQTMAHKVSEVLVSASLHNKPADNDHDGIYDFAEAKFGTSSLNADMDGDGLLDGTEVFLYKSNPHLRDSDGDGFSDDFEVNQLKSDPSNASPSPPKIKSYKIIKES